MIKISVLIPVYNVERFILRCVESIINQTMTDGVECIIVNDCTPDKSIEILEAKLADYSGPIIFKIINHEKNRGLAAARNTGIDNAIGEYIIHIDSDDFCESDMLEKMYGYAVKRNSDVVIADYYDSYKDRECRQNGQPNGTEISYVKGLIKGEVLGYVWNKLIRRSLILNNNLRNIEGMDMWEDYYFILQVFLVTNKISYLPCAFLHYVRNNPNSYTQNIKSDKKMLQNYIELEERTTSLYIAHNLYATCRKEILYRNIVFRNEILLRTAGDLQKQYNSYYNKPLSLSLLIGYGGIPVYWKVALLFASYNMLPIYNLVRSIWAKAKRISIEEVTIR